MTALARHLVHAVFADQAEASQLADHAHGAGVIVVGLGVPRGYARIHLAVRHG